VGEAGDVIIHNACNLKTTLTPIVENATNTVVTGVIATKELAEKNPGWTLTGVVATIMTIAVILSSSSSSSETETPPASRRKTPAEMGGVWALGGDKL
jgi:hypothetical protein